ncbi:hypothetical protein ACFO26_08565 [Lactococcus nasutitermitis]|uniref:Uncharacterized protein n=1 Tax=Lactococcus nasutitermitis TaxID=1652957 RepID=A0ABV9JFX1_9LACT|nr:hypothetical protein [Lactococcus nasutitermitis]
MKDFTQDEFFELGHHKLKAVQIISTLFMWLILLAPLLVLLNSLGKKKIWSIIYQWHTHATTIFTHFLENFIGVTFIVIALICLLLLLRNNHLEQKVYATKKTYDEEKLEKREEILEELYQERFGEEKFRATSSYYVVASEQNLPDTLVQDIFKERGLH